MVLFLSSINRQGAKSARILDEGNVPGVSGLAF
jgi:hypothetical protein